MRIAMIGGSKTTGRRLRRPFARTYQVLGMIIAFSLCLVKRPLAVWQVEPDRFSGQPSGVSFISAFHPRKEPHTCALR